MGSKQAEASDGECWCGQQPATAASIKAGELVFLRLASLASMAARARRTVTEQTGNLTLAANSAKCVAQDERWFNYWWASRDRTGRPEKGRDGRGKAERGGAKKVYVMAWKIEDEEGADVEQVMYANSPDGVCAKLFAVSRSRDGMPRWDSQSVCCTARKALFYSALLCSACLTVRSQVDDT
jgi:hypothetical protein|uniref:Uncharacterized protein n=1 Tax=Bionectria ochroleuca TaxID=29856 RepID=A0A8H7NJT8_BIOOC